jgi:hypothetical protein
MFEIPDLVPSLRFSMLLTLTSPLFLSSSPPVPYPDLKVGEGGAVLARSEAEEHLQQRLLAALACSRQRRQLVALAQNLRLQS